MKQLLGFLLFSGFFLSLRAQSGTIQGKVTTRQGEPLAGIAVTLNDTSAFTLTDSLGKYRFTGLADGNYQVSLLSGLTEKVKREMYLRNQETLICDIRFSGNFTELQEVIVRARKTQNERQLTIGKAGIAAKDLPQSVAVIDSAMLVNQQVQQLSDVLKNTNGVYVMGTTGGTQVEIAGRGYPYGSNNTFKNGVRFNNGILPELSALEKVEILKGSNALLYGNVAAGGILNLVTRKPIFEKGGTIQFRTGSNDLFKSSLDVYGAVNNSRKLAYRLNTSYEKANSFRNLVQSERFYISPSLLFKLSDKTQILVESDYMTDKRTLDYGTGAIDYRIAEIPITRFLGAEWSYNQAEQKTVTITTTHQLSGNWTIKNTSNYSSYEAGLMGTTRPNAGGNFIKPNGNWIRGVQRSATKEDYYLTQWDLTGHFQTGFLSHQLLVGADADQYHTGNTAYNSLRIYDSINIFDPLKFTQRKDIPDLKPNTFTLSRISRTGLYTQDLISITKNLKWLMGIRYTYLQNQTSLFYYANDSTSSKTQPYHVWTPRFGLVYQLLPNISVFASYANSFSLNNGLDTTGSPLSPSYLNQYEAGIKTDLLQKNLSVNLTLYRIVNSNLAQTVFPANSQYPNAQELAGEVTSKGLELDISSREYHGFMLLAGYSFNDTRYTKSNTYLTGSKLRYNPQHTANMSLYYSFTHSRMLNGFQLGTTILFTGERVAGRSTRLNILNDDHQLMPVPDFTQVDLSIGYVKDKISLRCKLSNLLNVRSYYIHDDNSVNPIAPRQFAATLSYRM